MSNGQPHDHPLTDILVHRIETYGPEADDVIRKISDFSTWTELHDWWDTEIGLKGDRELALQKANVRYAELRQRAIDNGWQVE